MRTEHYLFHVLAITPESRVKFVHSKGISFSPGSLLMTVLMRPF